MSQSTTAMMAIAIHITKASKHPELRPRPVAPLSVSAVDFATLAKNPCH